MKDYFDSNIFENGRNINIMVILLLRSSPLLLELRAHNQRTEEKEAR